jgi:hypothetical protein
MTSPNEVIIPTARAFELLDNCLDMLETAERDRDQERAAVVAFLRGPHFDGVIEEACVMAAAMIERGEHRSEETP